MSPQSEHVEHVEHAGQAERTDARDRSGAPGLPAWARDALDDVYDPCCREKGLSVLDMGLVRAARLDAGHARVELLLTSGWCPFAAGVLTEVRERVLALPGVEDADVEIVWDEAWTTDRLSEHATSVLRFLPPPAAVPDRDGYVSAHATTRE